jgi:hypothetical protein
MTGLHRSSSLGGCCTHGTHHRKLPATCHLGTGCFHSRSVRRTVKLNLRFAGNAHGFSALLLRIASQSALTPNQYTWSDFAAPLQLQPRTPSKSRSDAFVNQVFGFTSSAAPSRLAYIYTGMAQHATAHARTTSRPPQAPVPSLLARACANYSRSRVAVRTGCPIKKPLGIPCPRLSKSSNGEEKMDMSLPESRRGNLWRSI